MEANNYPYSASLKCIWERAKISIKESSHDFGRVRTLTAQTLVLLCAILG